MATQFEFTDTFGGEANYCWCKRWYCKEELTDRQAIRLGKALAGMTDWVCRKEEYGDTIALYPRRACMVLFILYVEDGYEHGVEVDGQGNIMEGVES